jgi:hypothetical protein
VWDREQIVRVSVGGPYIEAFQPKVAGILHLIEADAAIGSTPANCLEWANGEKRVVSVADKSGVTTHGLIVGLDESTVRLYCLGQAGTYEGDEILYLDDLLRVEVDGITQLGIEGMLGRR